MVNLHKFGGLFRRHPSRVGRGGLAVVGVLGPSGGFLYVVFREFLLRRRPLKGWFTLKAQPLLPRE